MKRTLTIFALVFLSVSGAALADAVSVTTLTSFSSPGGQSITATNFVSFQGPQTITFMVAGKTCNLNGSGGSNVSVNGCNYALTVAPNGSITGSLTAGSSGCTQSAQVASSCQ